MLCENCHQNEASVHLTQVVDGKVEKYHLCEGCAAQKGIDVHAEPMDLSGVMASLKEQLGHLKEELEDPGAPTATACPACGMTRTEILKKGRLGCDRCYEVFASEMLPVVLSLQHSDQHLGKVPRRSSFRMKYSVEHARLRRELDKAVAGENYELAARLRDQLKALPAEREGA
jgi:protein arginine kinase activator